MENKVIGYMRVSTIDQDPHKYKADILEYVNNKGWNVNVEFWEEHVSGLKSWKNRKLYDVVNQLNQGDALIVPELSRLGRSLREVLEIIEVLKDKGVNIYSVKENFTLNGSDMQSKIMSTMIGLFSEIERDMIAQRAKEGVQAARDRGKQVGRPKGSGKSKLDDHIPEIEALLKNGSTKKFIAQRYNISLPGLHQWMKKRNINKVQPQP